MIIRKKTILLVSLVVLLVIVGYINHQFTKQSLLESSNDYQDFEQSELAELGENLSDDESIAQTLAENPNDGENMSIGDLEIVDSKDTEVSDLASETSSSIGEALTNEEHLKSVNYFIEYRLSRDKLRAGLVDRLNEIINNEKTNEEMRSEAQNQIIRLGNLAEMELLVEGLIKAKGFEDALVFIDDDSARVVVSINELTEQDVMKILEIVKGETGLEPINIKIMKKF